MLQTLALSSAGVDWLTDTYFTLRVYHVYTLLRLSITTNLHKPAYSAAPDASSHMTYLPLALPMPGKLSFIHVPKSDKDGRLSACWPLDIMSDSYYLWTLASLTIAIWLSYASEWVLNSFTTYMGAGQVVFIYWQSTQTASAVKWSKTLGIHLVYTERKNTWTSQH